MIETLKLEAQKAKEASDADLKAKMTK